MTPSDCFEYIHFTRMDEEFLSSSFNLTLVGVVDEKYERQQVAG